MKKIIEREIEETSKKLGEVAGKLEGKTVLITGAAGFLGSYFVALLQYLNRKKFKNPVHIVALDNYITGVRDNIFIDTADPNLELIRHDVMRPFAIEAPIDYIIYAAGIASPVYYAKYPLETIAATIDGLKNILELARTKNPEGIVYFSSSEIYGDPHPESIPTPEDYHGNLSPIGLRACYDESKRLGETIATIYHRLHGLPISIIRPFNVYGPGMKVDDQRVLPNFLSAVIDGRKIEIHGNGEQTRTFAYATDAVNGFFRVLLLGKRGEAYNIGSDADEISMSELAKRVEKIHGEPAKIHFAGYPEGYPVGDPNRRRPDLTKARTQLEYDPVVDLDDGLRRMYNWFQLAKKRES